MSKPLIEKYRAKDFNELVDIPYEKKFQEMIKKPQELPNLLFYGTPGTGKTTAVQILLDKLAPIQYIKLNGSDARGIDTIRSTIYSFSISKSFHNGKPKIIWFEEFDYLTPEAFAALRGMIEAYISNVRYVCTCNYLTSIPDAIQSRFMLFEFKRPSEEGLKRKLRQIAKSENIQITDEDITTIINMSNRDVRTSLNYLQRYDPDRNDGVNTNEIQKVFTLIWNKKWTELRYLLPELTIERKQLLIELEQLFFNQSMLSPVKKAKITEIIAKYLFELKFSFNEDITVAAAASHIIKELLNQTKEED